MKAVKPSPSVALQVSPRPDATTRKAKVIWSFAVPLFSPHLVSLKLDPRLLLEDVSSLHTSWQDVKGGSSFWLGRIPLQSMDDL